MDWCASVDPFGFHKFLLGQDSIIGTYKDSRADKYGGLLSNNIICKYWTLLSLFLDRPRNMVWYKHNYYFILKHIFHAPNVNEKIAGDCYQEQLMGLVRRHNREAQNCICIEYMKMHSLIKGIATMAASRTTSLPPKSPITRRGE